MDISQAIKDAENALRDFIAFRMTEAKGVAWVDDCGLKSQTVKRWKTKQLEEQTRNSGAADVRLIYYADLNDLKKILDENWEDFETAFGDRDRTLLFLEELRHLRNPDAHNREFLTHEKHLAIGISGEIRTAITRYRSRMETSESYYPRIESIKDNLGNSWTPDMNHGRLVYTPTILRIGDQLEFVVAATDPMGERLECHFQPRGMSGSIMSKNNVLRVRVRDGDVGKMFRIRILVISNRGYHAYGWYDDAVTFIYEVRPPPVLRTDVEELDV